MACRPHPPGPGHGAWPTRRRHGRQGKGGDGGGAEKPVQGDPGSWPRHAPLPLWQRPGKKSRDNGRP
jgi:hypothetical protein